MFIILLSDEIKCANEDVRTGCFETTECLP